MGNKNRRSKQLAKTAEPAKIVEVNVEGPLTLDEAKVMGEVPADYHILEDEGLLKRASHLFMGEDKHENLPAIPDNAEGLTSEFDPKKVTFADPIHEEQVSEEPNKTKSDYRKSLLEFLHLKKKKDDDSDGDGEKLAAVEPHAVDIVEAPKHQDEEPVNEEIGAIENKVSSAMPTEDTPVASAMVSDSAKKEPAKKKGVFNNLFHHKKKEEEVAHKIETVETPKEAAVEDLEKTETHNDHAAPTETVTEKAADIVASGEEKTLTKRKSFFGGLFAKKNSNEPDVNEEVVEMEEAPNAEEMVHDDAVADTTGAPEAANADQTNSGGCFGFFGGTTNAEETEAPLSSTEETAVGEAQSESSTPPNTNRRWPFFGCSYPQPAANAEVIKAGTAQKQSYILHGNRFRHIRLMSDGVFQFGLKANHWKHAKGVKLADSMTVTTMENKSSFPAVVKVCMPGIHPIVLSFKTTGKRDEWETVLNDFKRRLSATTPNADGVVQVLKSSVFEEDDDAAGTGQVKEATSDN